MFSRSTAPEHCASGSDSLDKQARGGAISRSASAGVCMRVGRVHAQSSALGLALRVECANLLVEAGGVVFRLIDRRIVLLHGHLLDFLPLLLAHLLLVGLARVRLDRLVVL